MQGRAGPARGVQQVTVRRWREHGVDGRRPPPRWLDGGPGRPRRTPRPDAAVWDDQRVYHWYTTAHGWKLPPAKRMGVRPPRRTAAAPRRLAGLARTASGLRDSCARGAYVTDAGTGAPDAIAGSSGRSARRHPSGRCTNTAGSPSGGEGLGSGAGSGHSDGLIGLACGLLRVGLR